MMKQSFCISVLVLPMKTLRSALSTENGSSHTNGRSSSSANILQGTE